MTVDRRATLVEKVARAMLEAGSYTNAPISDRKQITADIVKHTVTYEMPDGVTFIDGEKK